MRTQIRLSPISEGTVATITQPLQSTSATIQSMSAVAVAVPSQSITAPSADAQVPRYRMQPWIQTVAQLWEEYDKGIAPAVGQPRGPSIRVLDETHESAWRQLPVVKKFYQRRELIWKEIIAASEDLGIPPEQVAEKMDRWRLAARNSPISLYKLNDLLFAVSKPPLWVLIVSNCFGTFRGLIRNIL